MRYNVKNIKRLADGKKVLKTTIPKTIPKKDDDIYIITQETDRLDLLASEFYKDSSLWWIIAVANNLGKGKLSVEIDTQLRIPTNITTILQNFKLINS